MIQNGGWVDMTMPSCIAPGNYLLRAEIIALHSAKNQGQAQFYMVCRFRSAMPFAMPSASSK
jgi:cellulase